MWPVLGFLLVPVVLGLETELSVSNYVLSIDECHTLKSIRPTNASTSELDLSSLSLECLDKSVFGTLNDVKILNLANNSLYGVPAFVFANLTRLEHLSLANNRMSRFEKTFEGLENLKTLNISSLPLKSLREGYLHGLSKSTDILMLNNSITSISTDVFDEGPDLDKPQTLRRRRSTESKVTEDAQDLFERHPYRVKVCMDKGVVRVAEIMKPDEALPTDCREVKMEYFDWTLKLTKMGIQSFAENWYRIDKTEPLNVRAVVLDNNDIARMTSELLNDLPESVRLVSLVGNRIERLEADVMANDHLAILRLSKNSISVIDDGAFAKMKLSSLEMSDNRLNDTKFASTIPWTLYNLDLKRNRITKIDEGSFANLNRTTELLLAGNNITSLQRDSLQGLRSLTTLDLTSNGLSSIEPGAFRHLKSVRSLMLPKNSISSLSSGVFEGVETECVLNLASNKFTTITRDTLPDLPVNLAHLYLDNNDIESLEAGSFIKLPKSNLALNGNRISRIEKGSFDLPELEILTLSGNSLKTVDGDSFAGLSRLQVLTISNNGINGLSKGSMKNLGSLRYLDISRNPIRRLNNGDLFGLRKSPATRIALTAGSVDVMQSGVFDYV